MRLDLEEFEQRPTDKIENFAARLREVLPTLQKHECSYQKPGGFLRRLRKTEGSRVTPVAIVTGDYFLEEDLTAELEALGAELRFKPLWLEDLVGLARNLLKVTH